MAKKKSVKKKPPPKKQAQASRAKKKKAVKKQTKKAPLLKKQVKKAPVKKAPIRKKPAAKTARTRQVGKKGLSLDDIKVVGGPLDLSSDQEVDAAEAKLGIPFPAGYREFVTRFGEGVLGGYYVRVYPPRRILSGSNNLQEWRERIDLYWFWDAGKDVLSKQQALESIIIGDTLDGDELLVHPSNPQRVYVLPRHSENIYVAGDGLLPALEWLCSSGTLTEPFAEREFEPFEKKTA